MMKKQMNSNTQEAAAVAINNNTPPLFSDFESDGEDEEGDWVDRLVKLTNNPDTKISIDIPSPSVGFHQHQRTSFSGRRAVVGQQQCPTNEINQGGNNEEQNQQQKVLHIGNRVDYMIVVCKNVETYSKQLLKKLSTISEGKNLTVAFHDTLRDLTKHRNKILAVYDAYKVSHARDKLGFTLAKAIELLGQVERASVLFGKKSKLGKSIQTILRDIGTNRNVLLGATSLIISDRPHLLYMVDKNDSEDREKERLRQDGDLDEKESILHCFEGDRSFYGRGEPVNYNKAAKAYAAAAMKGLPEAMYMLAVMHRFGKDRGLNDEEHHCHWLNSAIDKGYTPAMYDMGILMLDRANGLLSQYPSIIQAYNAAIAGDNTET